MRIGIDAHAAELDGTGNCTYIRNLIVHLFSIDSQNEYVLFVTNREHPFYRSIANRPMLKFVPVRKSPAWFRVFFALRSATLREKLDVFHVQYFAPWRHGGALVNTIHDLASYRFPQYFSRFEQLMFKMLLPGAANQSRLILTDSKISKDDLIHFLNTSEDKVRVIYCGVSDRFFNHRSSEEEKKKIRSQYELNDRFFLYVGRIDPRKNLLRIIEAYTRLRQQKLTTCQLVIAGKIYLEPPGLKELLARCEFQNDIRFCGYVSEEDLPALYSTADAFLYPSEHEGFGLPPLESMASETPVLASDIPIFREILGDAAILVDPLDVQAIADGMHRITTDASQRVKLIERGKSRAEQFNWASTAQQTLKCYQEAGKC
jgi:glycosyltransferase involved in cell wall biosynthesis